MDNFDDIRSYRQNEFNEVQQRLWTNAEFLSLLKKVPFVDSAEQMAAWALSFDDIHDFHHRFIRSLLAKVATATTASLEGRGFDKLEKNAGYLFISNHRDIVMDTVLLNHLLFENGIEPSETAIGNNLLIRPWINDFVRLNKAFVVKRNFPIKEQLVASKQLSGYIRESVETRHQSIWLAQREGRAKDSNDRTQISVIKMLNLSSTGNVLENLASLRPVPLSLSYEYDPCDYLKAKEMQLKRDVVDYRKTQADDLENMKVGITGFKGRVCYCAAPCISQELLAMDASMPKKDLFERIACLFDKKIHANYRLYPNHYVAADLLSGSQQYESFYTPEEQKRFQQYIEQQLEKIDLPESQKDHAFLRQKMWEMYANPLKNHYQQPSL